LPGKWLQVRLKAEHCSAYTCEWSIVAAVAYDGIFSRIDGGVATERRAVSAHPDDSVPFAVTRDLAFLPAVTTPSRPSRSR
jgi:hypothetical protein